MPPTEPQETHCSPRRRRRKQSRGKNYLEKEKDKERACDQRAEKTFDPTFSLPMNKDIRTHMLLSHMP